ncbi:TetR/AcrR family transcriptional regulator [Plantactinospora soyae]|uniref:AcrR family transcriptional regulator n=1 Tax=Plantactinospora soyae TaxID=1544732 RepID=A0A927LZ31_9ACTN|nr:TetR/AcrR family transcriptional regulator [Plantactinospora soyae]MBE1484564.1 AcrR family transcriptional regulator [Plantactinospora soyae]
MGHREQLLEGAKRCLYERGYARTTARDIVAASGTNLASIGYHFGSKDALLTAAMIEAMDEWGDELGRAIVVDPGATPPDRLAAIWTGVAESVTNHRPLWAASIDLLTQMDHQPELRERLAAAIEAGRVSFTSLVLAGVEAPADAGGGNGAGANGSAGKTPADGSASAVGSLVMAVITGLTVQCLLDPERAPSGSDLVAAIRTIEEAAG